MFGGMEPITIFIILTVSLFLFLGIAILIVMDHKAKIPGGFHTNPFSISGMRHDHPYVAFLTSIILLAIIASLVFEVTIAVSEQFGLFEEEEAPQLLQEIKEQRFTERMRRFHNEPLENKVALGKKQVCFQCHGDFPHSKERMIRSLLNMHTQFIGCMTCHVDEGKIDESKYRFAWVNYSGIQVTGEPFGISNDPDTGNLFATDDYYSKIVVYETSADQNNLLEITENRPEVQEFMKIKDTLLDRDRDAIKKRFHKLVKSKGRFCPTCHVAEESAYLPYRKLGFSEKRISELTALNITGLIQKYKKFYMPKLFQPTPRSNQ